MKTVPEWLWPVRLTIGCCATARSSKFGRVLNCDFF